MAKLPDTTKPLTQKKQLPQKESKRHMVLKTLFFALLIFLVYGLLSLFLGKQLHSAGIWFSEHLGLWGVGIYCFIVDMFILPTTVDILFPLVMYWNPYSVLTVMSLASAFGGFCGYLFAHILNTFPPVRRQTAHYHEKGKRLLEHYGAWAIVIAGLTPVPFSTVCWIAGVLKVPPLQVFLGCFSRIPRMILYYLLIKSGISLFTV